MTDIITTNALCKKYGEAMSVKDLDLKVPRGVVYGFLGPNGAGKSTTMKMILGLAKPTSGTITVFGKEMIQRNRLTILKEAGSLIESPSYYAHLTGRENLKIISTLKGVEEEEIDRVLKIVRLENQKDKKAGQYSLGMKQRLGLAGALLGNPKLLILDEPTNGLDPAGIQEMRELIRALPKTFGMTVMVSSHLLNEIEQMADHIGVISKGELVFQDRLKVLHDKSKSSLAVRTLDNEAAKGVFQRHGIMCREEGAFLLLPELSDQELSAHIFHLFHETIGVVRLEERKKTLEEIFIELTGTAVSL
jgi:ABC-2 type transport system ATP-binding protein